jgi:hemolysin III
MQPELDTHDPPAPGLKPRLRGVSHKYAFFVALLLGAALVISASTSRATFAAIVYGLGICGLFGVSALYHRINWAPEARRWMRRADHAMIFVFIAASYTPIALLVLHGALAPVVLAVVWGGALAGVVLSLVWIDAPKWLSAVVYVALGWVAVVPMPQLWSELGALAVLGLAAGGVLYTAGAVIYARGRPNPRPGVFGYHEVFHAFVIAAAAAHFAVNSFAVFPRA